MNKISEIVKLSPGYKSAVHIEHDMENYEKVSAFIPTEIGSQCLELVAKSLNPECKDRSFLITGTYGTGKSHLALVFANLLKHEGITLALNPVMEKIQNKWHQRYELIKHYRTEVENKPFLVVTLYQDEGRMNDALLRKLDDVLSKRDLRDILPDTVFTAALKRIEQVRNDYPDALNILKKIIEEEGLVSLEHFENRLRNYEKTAFEIFRKIHPLFSQGSNFDYHQNIKAKDVYISVAKKLKEKGFAGIAVLWDEFGRYLERSLEETKSDESLDLQEFAETCNDSYLHKEGVKLFTFLIAHREMPEYLALARTKMTHVKSDEERKSIQLEIEKIQGRFRRDIRMKTSDTETFDLIEHVIINQKNIPLWQTIKRKGIFDIWADKCTDAKIFPEFNRETILNTIVEGTYPLHPVTTCCLPKLSEKVAQNERTFFQFLCKDEPNGVFAFIKNPIETKDGNLSTMTVDKLMDYFREEIRRCDREQIKKLWKEYHYAEGLLVNSPDLYKKIAKAIAILTMASDERIKFNTTPEFIDFSLNENTKDVLESLESMSSKTNLDRILTKSAIDGTYRFYGAGSVDIDIEIEKIMTEGVPTINPIKILDRMESQEETKLWDILDLSYSIEPKSYNDDFKMNRKIDIKPIDIKKLDGFKIINDGTQDGILLLFLSEIESEIKKVIEILNIDNLHNPRVLIAIPKQPIQFTNLVRRYWALKILRQERKELFGSSASYEDEWNYKNEECRELMKKVLSPLINPEKNLMDYYWKGELLKGITSQAKLEKLAADMMGEAYPNTPIVVRNELKEIDGNDTFKKFRKSVIDNLLKEDGASQLGSEKSLELLPKGMARPATKDVINVLKNNNALVKKQGVWVIEKPADNPNMAKVWDAVDTFILSCRMPGKPASPLIQTLLSPPFGIRRRSMPIILATPLRKYVLQGNLTFKDRESVVDKIDSELIEAIVANPERYTIVYTEVGERQKAIVDGMYKVFEIDGVGELGERLISLKEKVVTWWQALPPFARKTSEISENADLMRKNVFILLANEPCDEKRIFFENLPKSIEFGDAINDSFENLVNQIQGKIKPIKNEFENVTTKLDAKIFANISEVFGGNSDDDPIQVISQWHEKLGKKGDTIESGDAGKLFETCRKLKEKGDKSTVIDFVAQVTGSKPENWNDSNRIIELTGQLKTIKKNIEEQTSPSDKPKFDKEYISINLVIDGKEVTRRFKKAASISQLGTSMANLINNAIGEIGKGLPEEEKFTVLTEILKEHLK